MCVCVCVCACACMWNKKDIFAFETSFLFFRILHTNTCTNTSFRAVSLVKLHTIFRISIPLNTTQPIANTIMSTKLTDDTLQLFIVKSPISTIFIHIAFKLHDINKRNIFTIELLTYETISECIDSTNAMEC